MTRQSHRSTAFSLVEVTLAIGVAGFCLIAVFALLPVGIQTNQHAIAQTAAVSIFSAVVADMRATSAQFGIAVPADASNASGSTTLYIDGEGRVVPSADRCSLPTNSHVPSELRWAKSREVR